MFQKAILSLMIMVVPLASMAKNLLLEDFLTQVKESGQSYEAAKLSAGAFQLESRRPSLAFQPYFTSSYRYQNSIESGFFSFLREEDTQKNHFFSFGLAKDWSTGTSTSLNHIINRYNFKSSGTLNGITWQNQIALQVQQDLWKNFFGREKSNLEKSQSLDFQSQSLQQSFEMRSQLAQAENAYWTLALSMETLESLSASVKRAQGILDWNRKRYNLKLIDKGDLLQSEAQVLALTQKRIDGERAVEVAHRNLLYFLSREYTADESERLELSALSFDLEKTSVPDSWTPDSREDLLAARAAMESADRRSIATQSSLDPELKLTGSLMGDSASSGFSKSESQAFSDKFREIQVGVQLNIPLGVRRNLDLRDSAKMQAQAQKLKYAQTKLALEKQFQDLRREFTDLKEKIKIGEKRKSTESQKLANEERRFKQGRSTSFQVLTFQEDLNQAELDVLRLYREARSVLTSLNLYNY